MAKTWGNRWRNLRELVPGGQAQTFVVVDVNEPTTERVLKRLKNTSAERRARFEQEIQAVRRLAHPNIIELIDFDLTAEEPYLVTEYCASGSLGDLNIGAVEDGLFRKWFGEICDALAFAHSQGLVHRDIKPDNIFLRSSTGPAVIGDFGLVFVDGQERVTLTHEQVGSRFFMAPELRDGRADRIAQASDIYSLGKLLHWMFGHGKMFDRENHREDPNNLVTIRRNYYLEHLHVLLDRMITPEPGARFQNAREVLEPTNEVWRLMDGQYNPLGRPDQPCRYCGRGFYSRMSEDNYFNLGWSSRAINQNVFRLLRCSVCGNLQSFWTANTEAGDWVTRASVPKE